MTYTYMLYTLTVASEIQLPQFQSIPLTQSPDVTITYGSVPEAIESTGTGVLYAANPREFRLDMPDIAVYYAADGARITIAPYPGVHDDTIRLFLIGSVFGALLHQRGMLPMHASAIVAENAAVLFTGASGAGKSTTAAKLAARGYRLLADDITVVYARSDGKPIASPAFPQMKLWAQSLQALDVSAEGLARIRPELEKFQLPIADRFHDSPLPVRKLYILNPHNTNETEFVPLRGMRKIRVLRNQVYHRRIMEIMSADASHFAAVTALATHTPITVLKRPQEIGTIDAFIDALEADLHA